MGIPEVKDQPENGPRRFLGSALVEIAGVGAIKKSIGLLIFPEQMGRDRIALQVLRGEVVVTGGEFSVDLHPVTGRLSRTRHIGSRIDCSLCSLLSLIGMAIRAQPPIQLKPYCCVA